MCHSRENGNPDQLDPQSEALRFRLRMTRGNGSRIKCGMTGGAGSPIRSASLSVEDDTGCVIPVKTGIQSEWIPHQVRDDKECVIPAQAGIQAGLDPQSEALCFRLRTA